MAGKTSLSKRVAFVVGFITIPISIGVEVLTAVAFEGGVTANRVALNSFFIYGAQLATALQITKPIWNRLSSSSDEETETQKSAT